MDDEEKEINAADTGIGTAGSTLGGAVAGAVAGTALGVPVVGTVIGGLSGAAIGAARKRKARKTRKVKAASPKKEEPGEKIDKTKSEDGEHSQGVKKDD